MKKAQINKLLGKRKRELPECAESRKKISSVAKTENGDEHEDPSTSFSKESTLDKQLQPDEKTPAMRMMENMGYEKGKGLGKKKQGIIEPISTRQRLGRTGFGADTEALKQLDDLDFDAKSEIKTVEEEPNWLRCSETARNQMVEKLDDKWIVVGKPKMRIDDEDRYCERQLIAELLEAKNVFDTVDRRDLDAARARANPYETIKAGFFQNRAAMKTANLDKIYGWRLSWESDERRRFAKNPIVEGQPNLNTDREMSLFYFADVCAGPGGFSEYMLWRKSFYNAKGFGFTLEGRDDFKLDRFKSAPSEYFEPFYGVNGDGNVVDPDNLNSLEEFVRTRIHGKDKGVHLVMCDGGFSVEGQENLQEILSKRLYLCQFLVGLLLCRVSTDSRRGGNFLCKLFDVFTPFSMGLIYLMYASFERISIHKPITSRPANSERYIFCENLNQFGANRVKQYLTEVNNQLNAMDSKKEDILELVPDEIIQGDPEFMNYMRASCKQIARRQVYYLQKYRKFALEPSAWDQDQAKLRVEALRYWELPDFIERAPEVRRSGGSDGHQQWQRRQQQQMEPAGITLERLTANQFVLPSPRRLPKFTANELMICPDVNELRSLLLTDDKELVLLSQGYKNLFYRDRKADQFDRLYGHNCLTCTIPKDTILLVQMTNLYKVNPTNNKRLIEAGKCLWVLDAAVLNGDDISRLELKKRLEAARKFCDAINRRSLRETARTTQQRGSTGGGRRSTGAQAIGRYDVLMSELIVADVQRLNALVQRKFQIKYVEKMHSTQACIPVWAGDDPREKPPDTHFIVCRGVRIQSILHPNFMLLPVKNERTGQLEETPVPRQMMIDQKQSMNCYTNFYESFHGFIPMDQWRATFPIGHPLNGAVTFHWSWQPDYTDGYNVKNILSDPEHKGGLTLEQMRRIVSDRLHQQQHHQQQQQKQETDHEHSQYQHHQSFELPNQDNNNSLPGQQNISSIKSSITDDDDGNGNNEDDEGNSSSSGV